MDFALPTQTVSSFAAKLEDALTSYIADSARNAIILISK